MTLLNPRVLKIKGVLFLVLGLVSASLIFTEMPSLRIGILLAISIWAFCRFYYFAFYVLQNYADPEFRYSGLVDLVRYLVSKRS